MRFIFILCFLSACVSQGQSDNCLTKLAGSEHILQQLPKDKKICAYADSMTAFKVTTGIDLNLDGLQDKIVFLRTNKNTEGTQQVILFCLATSNPTDFNISTNNNILPVFYTSYSLEHITTLPKSQQEAYIYNEEYPLIELSFKNGRIRIVVKTGSLDEARFIYEYNAKVNDFIFTQGTYYENGKIVEGELEANDFNFDSKTIKDFKLENLFLY